MISIHTMFLFYIFIPPKKCGWTHFNTYHVSILLSCSDICILQYCISIHTMFLFYTVALTGQELETNFNTYHVSILHGNYHTGNSRGQISIHTMFLFYTTKPILSCPFSAVFQYIPCFYFTHITSKKACSTVHFNTYHVSILPNTTKILYNVLKYFNTYHVSILRHLKQVSLGFGLISIHTMFLFYTVLCFHAPAVANFNTYHVSILPRQNLASVVPLYTTNFIFPMFSLYFTRWFPFHIPELLYHWIVLVLLNL